jgi:hypothetical protein
LKETVFAEKIFFYASFYKVKRYEKPKEQFRHSVRRNSLFLVKNFGFL